MSQNNHKQRQSPVMQGKPSNNPSSITAEAYTIKPGIRNLILAALGWAILTNLVYIFKIDQWLLFSWIFGNETGRSIWGTCTVILPLSAIIFVKILEPEE